MENDNNTGINTENENNNTNNEEAKNYSAEEVQQLIQAEADRRTNQALAKQKKDYEKKLSLSNLDEQQRKEAEASMKIQELQEQLSQFQVEKNKSELKSVLSSRGLSAQFADVISVTEDIEANQKNIDVLDKLFKEAVKVEVEKRMSSSTPKKNLPMNETLNKESFKKLSLQEQAEIYKNNPELYKTLI